MVIIEILIIIILIMLNGFFAMSEIALLSVKKIRLKYLRNKNDHRAEKVLYLVNHSSEMLATIQVAITTIGIVAGAFSGATVAVYLQNWLANYSALAFYSETIAIVSVVILVTYFSLVIGELIPKQIAIAHSEKISLRVANFIILVMKTTKPIVKLLSISTKTSLKLLNIKPKEKHKISEEDIKLLLAEGVKSGTFEKPEVKMVKNIFHLGNRPIKDFMTPQKDIIWLDIKDSFDDIKYKIKQADNTVFPIYINKENNTIGAIETNDMLKYLFSHEDKKIDLKDLIQEVTYIDSNTSSLLAIDKLKKLSIKIAIVADKKNNKILGIISFHDILEAIVGEFQIKHQ